MYFKKAYDSGTREVLCNFIVAFGTPVMLVILIKLCLNETYKTVRVGKHLTDIFPIKNDFPQGDALSSKIFSFVAVYAIRRMA
jgi:hypothetical protein